MPLLIYTLLRIALFVAVYLVLAFVGFRGWLLIVAAVLIAALLSFLLLPRQADAAAGLLRRGVGERVSSRLDRSFALDADAEDAAVEDAGTGTPDRRREAPHDQPPPGPSPEGH